MAQDHPPVEKAFKRGDRVQVFYRTNADPGGYFPVPNLAAGCLRPRFGRTDGWIDATVEADWPPVDAGGGGGAERYPSVKIRHVHPHWSNRHGERLNPDADSDMVVWMSADDVRPRGAAAGVSLSVLVVRWGGEQTQFNVEQWGRASASVSDEYISCFLDETLYEHLGPDYEVFTAFVQSGADMAKLMAPPIAAAMTGRHRCGAYFLWPVMATDGECDQSGMVHQEEYFAAVRGFEASGIPTRFPHPSQLYQMLLSKEWQTQACLLPRFHVPPVTTVNRASVVADPLRAARSALDALEEIRSLRYGGADQEPACIKPGEGEVRKGVVKLGYAWEAAHVRLFRGEKQLALALHGLATEQGSESCSVFVQDFCRNQFEMRLFVVRGEVAHIVYSNFENVDVDGYCRDFVKKSRGDAINDWLSGDAQAMDQAEKKCKKMVKQWLTWLRCQSSEPIAAIRMDMLISRAHDGSVEVHTLELTECGFSMLAWPEGPQTVFGALLASCFEDTGPTEAARLPSLTKRATPSSVESAQKPGKREKN
ncbi:hypothetical protein AB1Y20_014704 [Prymnesium parvum]|uniref:Uncharacterized protein n=1 Tax=Prymnesium parvum TaxID=97485 RepID=A0AB34IE83_PRYPA